MENLIAPLSTFPPRVFWNLLCVSFFHLLGLWLLRSRLEKLSVPLPSNPSYDPSVLAVMVLERFSSEEAAAVEAMLSQLKVRYRLLILTTAQASTAQASIQTLLDAYPQVKAQLCGFETFSREALGRLFPQGLETRQVESQALAACIQQLENSADADEPDIVAMVHPQLVPHPYWLSQLVAPLDEPEIVATTACPWLPPFMSRKSGISSLLQYALNGFSALPLLLFPRVSWSGAIAIKRNFFDRTRLRLWQVMGATDIALGRLIDRKQFKVQVILNLMTTRRRVSSFSSFVPEIQHRLGALRRHHGLWIILAGQGIFVSITAFRAYRRFLSELLSSESLISPWLCVGIIVYWAVIFLLISTIESSVRSIERYSQPTTMTSAKRPISWLILGPTLFVLTPIAQLIHCFNIVLVLFQRRYRPQRNRLAFLKRLYEKNSARATQQSRTLDTSF